MLCITHEASVFKCKFHSKMNSSAFFIFYLFFLPEGLMIQINAGNVTSACKNGYIPPIILFPFFSKIQLKHQEYFRAADSLWNK